MSQADFLEKCQWIGHLTGEIPLALESAERAYAKLADGQIVVGTPSQLPWGSAVAYACRSRLLSEGIGDVNGSLMGGGARYNTGKPPLDLIPLRILADTFPCQEPATIAFKNIACWQEGGTRQDLMNAINALGKDGWVECARVFDYGRDKYAAWNWARGMPWSAPLACAARHLLAMLNGEETDAESGLPHRGHVFCNLVMLLTYHDTYPTGDDRPSSEFLTSKAAK